MKGMSSVLKQNMGIIPIPRKEKERKNVTGHFYLDCMTLLDFHMGENVMGHFDLDCMSLFDFRWAIKRAENVSSHLI